MMSGFLAIDESGSDELKDKFADEIERAKNTKGLLDGGTFCNMGNTKSTYKFRLNSKPSDRIAELIPTDVYVTMLNSVIHRESILVTNHGLIPINGNGINETPISNATLVNANLIRVPMSDSAYQFLRGEASYDVKKYECDIRRELYNILISVRKAK